MLTINWRWNTR